jgi:hypothetical protein
VKLRGRSASGLKARFQLQWEAAATAVVVTMRNGDGLRVGGGDGLF